MLASLNSQVEEEKVCDPVMISITRSIIKTVPQRGLTHPFSFIRQHDLRLGNLCE